MLEAINLSLAERPIDGQYVSMIYAIWDDNQRSLQVANSGLPRPLHLRDGKVEEIQVTGLPIGLFSSATYDERNLRGKPGDVFLFLSDGITDATSSAGNMFGRGRLEKIVLKPTPSAAPTKLRRPSSTPSRNTPRESKPSTIRPSWCSR